jgi:hypothetical protein
MDWCLSFLGMQGVLLQIFTRPLSDRPTIFLEIIQRIGCERVVKEEVRPNKNM